MAGCGHCGTRLEIVGNQVGRGERCPSCDEAVHACRSCRHRDPQAVKSCREPFAEVPQDPDAANFCEYFQLGDGGQTERTSKQSLLETAESLFRKPPSSP